MTIKTAGVLAGAALFALSLSVQPAAARGGPDALPTGEEMQERDNAIQNQSSGGSSQLAPSPNATVPERVQSRPIGQPSSALNPSGIPGLASAARASELIGTTVVNASNEKIGTIDDILLNVEGKAAQAVISVGGFLGLGSRLVAVPYDSLSFDNDQALLAGGSKGQLQALPDFQYPK
jgi:sporulation protein YlmC with PRC-barrel domain